MSIFLGDRFRGLTIYFRYAEIENKAPGILRGKDNVKQEIYDFDSGCFVLDVYADRLQGFRS